MSRFERDVIITDGSTDYMLPVWSQQGKRALTFSTRASQPGDPTQPWRIPLHPWNEGLKIDRLRDRPASYGKANGDLSNLGLFLHPPKLNSVTLTNGNAPTKLLEFNSKVYILGGRYMYAYDPAAGTAAEDKDFGVGKAAVDMAVFGNELIVAMGESEKIWKRTTTTWSQATDSTFAIALGTADDKLWRAESTNKISNCITAPLTLTSWVPASPNQYVVGNSTWAINTIIDFQGALWVGKGDGIYQADPKYVFHNQTPQLRQWPSVDNCKGAFVAQGALWVPSVAGLLKLRLGSSLVSGPETTARLDYQFRVRGGIEFGGHIYVIVDDQSTTSNTFICKMVRDSEDMNKYYFHEFVRLGGNSKSYAITVSVVGTNPQLIVPYGNNLRYLKLGRGGGRDVDDANYEFGTAAEFESGPVLLTHDMAVQSIIEGAEVVSRQPHADCSITVSYKANEAAAYTDMLTTQLGGGTAAIALGAAAYYKHAVRFASVDAQATFAEFKVSATVTSTTRANRQEIREVWIFGHNRPRTVEVLKVSFNDDGISYLSSGLNSGISIEDMANLFRMWQEKTTTLIIKIPDYEEDKTCYFIVAGFQVEDVKATPGNQNQIQSQRVLTAELVRLYYGPLTTV